MTTVLKDPIVSNPVSAAIDALKGGRSVEEAVYGTVSSGSKSAAPTSASDSSAEDALEGATDGNDETGVSLPSALDNVSDSVEAATSKDLE